MCGAPGLPPPPASRTPLRRRGEPLSRRAALTCRWANDRHALHWRHRMGPRPGMSKSVSRDESEPVCRGVSQYAGRTHRHALSHRRPRVGARPGLTCLLDYLLDHSRDYELMASCGRACRVG